jgi:hypothetical protein
MANEIHSGAVPHYDRDYLLSAQKRNQILELWEVEKFGRDSFRNPDAVSLYGIAPVEWYARGVRILARTAVEAARDPLAKQIGERIAQATAGAGYDFALGVVDPFAGSCNALFWVVRQLPGAEGLGFEDDQSIYDMTSRNIALLGAPIKLAHGDCRLLLGQLRLSSDRRIIALLAPPWANALDLKSGLDLSRTKPPIAEIVDEFERVYPKSPVLYVVEVHERLAPEPVAQLREKFDWSELKIFDVGGPTGRHGILLGEKRWR